MRPFSSGDRPPPPMQPAQSLVLSTGDDHRLAALLFDRVHPHGSAETVPPEIRAAPPPSLETGSMMPIFRRAFELLAQTEYREALRAEIDASVSDQAEFDPSDWPVMHLAAEVATLLLLIDTRAAYAKLGIASTAWCTYPSALDLVGKRGTESTLQLTLTNVPVIDSTDLGWDHITEVRADPDFRHKARRFRLLLDESCAGKPASYVSDFIEQSLAEFDDACRSQGLKTIRAVVSQVLDSKSLIGVAGIAAMGALFGSPIGIGSALVGGAALEIGKATLTVMECRAEANELRNNSPVALLVAAREAMK